MQTEFGKRQVVTTFSKQHGTAPRAPMAGVGHTGGLAGRRSIEGEASIRCSGHCVPRTLGRLPPEGLPLRNHSASRSRDARASSDQDALDMLLRRTTQAPSQKEPRAHHLTTMRSM
ncbi:hypothetical protein [Azospirillum palustre]